MNTITNALFNLAEKEYQQFTKKLVPDTKYPILGIRVPKIKQIIKNYDPNVLNNFIKQPHEYYEEYFLHGLIIGQERKDINKVFEQLNEFISYIDNWAICDSTVANLKIFKKHPDIVLDKIKSFLESSQPYIVRFGIVSLLTYYMDDNFSVEILSLLKNVNFNNYYVNMAVAWALSVAVIKQPEFVIPLLENKSLLPFIQNKTIQKSTDSFRVPIDTKKLLKQLKI